MVDLDFGMPAYHLTGDGVSLSYWQEGTGVEPPEGRPRTWWKLTYRDSVLDLEFESEQIRVTGTEIGSMVTVSLDGPRTTGGVTFSLFLPGINGKGTVPFETVGIRTTHRPSAEGSAVAEPTESYEPLKLQGTRRFAPFPV